MTAVEGGVARETAAFESVDDCLPLNITPEADVVFLIYSIFLSN